MSQLQFQVSIIGANSKTKAVVPASPSTTSSSSHSSSNNNGANLFSSQLQLPCSPIAPARIVLKNTEKYPVYFKVFTDRPSSASSSSSQDQEQQTESVFIHPTRGAVKPNKSMTIAVVLAPPPNPLERTLQKSSSSSSANQANQSEKRKRSQTPKKVSFAPDEEDEDDNFNKSGSEYYANNADDHQQYTQQKNASHGIVCRMKIEAVVILSGNTNSNFQQQNHHFLHNHDHDDENVATGEAVELLSSSKQTTATNNTTGGRQQQQHLISKQEFDRQWNQGVQIPSRIFDIVSVKPMVSRDQYLHYLVTRKLHRCERLVRRCEAYENQCATILRQIEDMKEADIIERTRELESCDGYNGGSTSFGGVGDVDSTSNKSSLVVGANFHFFAFALGIVASFMAGYNL